MIQFVSLLLFVSATASAVAVGDFKKQVYHGDSTHPHLWALELLPPAGNHFNLEAPKSAQQEKIKLDLVSESPEKLVFQTENRAVHSGSVIEVSAFVCDDKKTYCMKKKMFITLEERNSKVINEKFSAKKEAKVAWLPEPKKDAELFMMNTPAKAIAEAKKTKKPLLIDFYGIWCPPCNLYNETIFNSKEFATQSEKFVLLKLDADAEISWELKSKFKIGGYPTLLIAKVNGAGELEEVERIVGYYPPREFYSRLNQAYQHRNDSPELRWKGRLEELLAAQLEQKNYDEILKLTEMKKEAQLLIYRWIAETKKNAEFIKDSKNLEKVEETIEAISKNLQSYSSDTLMRLFDYLNDEFWLKKNQYYKLANGLLDQLAQRIDPNTLFVSGSELTAPDLDAMRMDLEETLNNHDKVSEIRKIAIAHYEKLINFFANNGKRDLRSMNLEYAFLLWKDGRVDQAKKLYDQFIQKYPAEFTFYYAASKMYSTLKDLAKARELAEKALQYSYGDNRLRAMDRLVGIMAEQGLRQDAILRGNELLKTVKSPQGLNIRTQRYIDALKETISKIEKSKTEEAKK